MLSTVTIQLSQPGINLPLVLSVAALVVVTAVLCGPVPTHTPRPRRRSHHRGVHASARSSMPAYAAAPTDPVPSIQEGATTLLDGLSPGATLRSSGATLPSADSLPLGGPHVSATPHSSAATFPSELQLEHVR